MKRYYYKAKSGSGILNLKAPLGKEDAKKYDEITEKQFLALIKKSQPSADQIALKEKRDRIAFLKRELARTDYCALKLAEGETTLDGEYKDVFAQRKLWRAEINQLEAE